MKAIVLAALLVPTVAAADHPLAFDGTTASFYAGYARLAQDSAFSDHFHSNGGLVGIDFGARFGQRPFLHFAVLVDVQASFYHADLGDNQIVQIDAGCNSNVWSAALAIEYAPVPYVFARFGLGALIHAGDHCHVDQATSDYSQGGQLDTELRVGFRAPVAPRTWVELAGGFDWYGSSGAITLDTTMHADNTASVTLGIRGTYGRAR